MYPIKPYPIYPEEIQRFRDSIKVGDTIQLKAPTNWMDHIKKRTSDIKKMETCVVKGKFGDWILAVNEKGSKRTVRYVDLIKEERKKKHV